MWEGAVAVAVLVAVVVVAAAAVVPVMVVVVVAVVPALGVTRIGFLVQDKSAKTTGQCSVVTNI